MYKNYDQFYKIKMQCGSDNIEKNQKLRLKLRKFLSFDHWALVIR